MRVIVGLVVEKADAGGGDDELVVAFLSLAAVGRILVERERR